MKSSEYAAPVLGLIFLRFADYRFTQAKEKIEMQTANSRRLPSKVDYQHLGVMYVPEKARYDYLLNLPESENISEAVKPATKNIEEENPTFKEAFPTRYSKILKPILVSLLKKFNEIDMSEHNSDTLEQFINTFWANLHRPRGKRVVSFLHQTRLSALL